MCLRSALAVLLYFIVLDGKKCIGCRNVHQVLLVPWDGPRLPNRVMYSCCAHMVQKSSHKEKLCLKGKGREENKEESTCKEPTFSCVVGDRTLGLTVPSRSMRASATGRGTDINKEPKRTWMRHSRRSTLCWVSFNLYTRIRLQCRRSWTHVHTKKNEKKEGRKRRPASNNLRLDSTRMFDKAQREQEEKEEDQHKDHRNRKSLEWFSNRAVKREETS